jgi:hypothetical protein
VGDFFRYQNKNGSRSSGRTVAIAGYLLGENIMQWVMDTGLTSS